MSAQQISIYVLSLSFVAC